MTLQEGIDKAHKLINKLDNNFNYYTLKQLKELREILFEDLSNPTRDIWIKYNNEFIVLIDKKIKQYYDREFFREYSPKEIDFIKGNSYILPLVLTNNKSLVRLTGENRYMFLCQMHKEVNPSMGVNDLLNYYYCYGCGDGNNAIGYLMKYENLKYKDALNLLSQIYLLAIKDANPKLSLLSKKYKDTILSDAYKLLLNLGKERLESILLSSDSKLRNVNIDLEYEKRFHTIDRISKNIYIEPNNIKKLTKKL